MAISTITSSLKDEIDRLAQIVQKLSVVHSDHHKVNALLVEDKVESFLKENYTVDTLLSKLEIREQKVLLSLIVCNQIENIFLKEQLLETEKVQEFLKELIPVDTFYSELEGIVGYHLRLLKLLEEKKLTHQTLEKKLFAPKGYDITEENDEVRSYVLSGIKHLPFISEIYPVGGAADRLDLKDETTGAALPAAKLNFLGRTLLEGMIRDLQAREYLYYKLYQGQVTTPVLMMTSHEKRNHLVIENILENNQWFNRPKDSFFLYPQLSVPTIDADGNWCLEAPMKLLVKPGGHGVIWKLAKDRGAFEWLLNRGRIKALVRQVNNPLACVDYGVLAFLGIGCLRDKYFGFASCDRVVGAAEGMNVLMEKQLEIGYEYTLTNIEYCDFQKFGIDDIPASQGSAFSAFPSNTNILFADLNAVNQVLDINPLPGALINFKKNSCITVDGISQEKEIGRLESTMQNIADSFAQFKPHSLEDGETKSLKVFLTNNVRKKTISTVKRSYTSLGKLLETPEGCFADLQNNYLELLTQYCEVVINTSKEETYPPIAMFYHPALGPLYSIIAQKIHRGIIQEGSELNFEISELYLKDFKLEGSVRIEAQQPLGVVNEEDQLVYSEKCGRCYLENVVIQNKGIDRSKNNFFWKREIHRHESLLIVLKGNSEFYAKDVTFKGDMTIEVEDGYRVTAIQNKGKIELVKERISTPSWWWEYEVGERNQIKLALKKASN